MHTVLLHNDVVNNLLLVIRDSTRWIGVGLFNAVAGTLKLETL